MKKPKKLGALSLTRTRILYYVIRILRIVRSKDPNATKNSKGPKL